MLIKTKANICFTFRPMTSHGFPAQEGPGADTHYTEEFRKKAVRPGSPLRPGTASGNRANKPHPQQVGCITYNYLL